MEVKSDSELVVVLLLASITELGVEGVGLDVIIVGAKPSEETPFKTPLIAC